MALFSRQHAASCAGKQHLEPLNTTYLEFMACDDHKQLDAGKDYGKRRTKYPDFAMTDTGLQYQDLREGSGRVILKGDRVTVDWDGYTIGECSDSSLY